MHTHQQSIGRQRAVALSESNWWEGRTAREIAKFQLFTVELCMPFNVFHRALQEALGRPVWRHELGLCVDELIQEFLGERDAPAVAEILALLPQDKCQPVIVE
ncbi:MAG: hypothetical protein Q7S40_17965 [Opitutaceae bacterium]|nr:hypothetical protein [Opitutaceae bacterium]